MRSEILIGLGIAALLVGVVGLLPIVWTVDRERLRRRIRNGDTL